MSTQMPFDQGAHPVIEQIDDRLIAWIREIVGDVAISLEPPGSEHAGEQGHERGVSLYLVAIVKKPPLRGPAPPPLQIALRYLVTVWAPTPGETHQLLDKLVWAALAHPLPEMEVDLEPLPATFWLALGEPPQPALLLTMPARQERPRPTVTRVRLPLDVHFTETGPLSGTLLGPDDTPIPDAVIEIPGSEQQTVTDSTGRFLFPRVPRELDIPFLRVRAKGLIQEIPIDTQASPLVIRMTFPS